MKISEMIKRLSVLKDIVGDVEVCVYSVGELPHVESAVAELTDCVKVRTWGDTKFYDYENFDMDDGEVEQVVCIY